MPAHTDTIGPPRRPRRVARPLVWVIFATVSLASVLALAGDWNWFADLFTHFRLYYLLAQGLLVIVFLNTRRYLWLAVTLLLALPNAWYVGPYLVPLFTATDQRSESATPQVVTLNLSFRNRDPAAAIDYLQQMRPETVVFSEYTQAWHAALEPALDDWPYRVLRPRSTPFGMAIYSREPLGKAEFLDLGVPNVENLRVELPGRGLDLYAVHLLPPVSPQLARGRNLQLDTLSRLMSRSTQPRLLTGDLNLTPFSPYFERLLNGAGLVDARRSQGLHVTWPAVPAPLWIAIDHVLADPAAGVVDVRTGPDIGSDHFPLEITLAPEG